ncbi:SWIM zinc finger family protein [Halobaculum lipolyticum]|uniref:SWIM zinc finger family protein n=1 Tax=Halobaculum lipolyticum TaxID=3032001 RepID=A0ABD5WDE6_9EURY|nr:SWIM zinc finger family protein [Halobaculum sp. DT31]
MRSNHVLTKLEVSPGPRRRAQIEPFTFSLVAEGVRVTNHRYEEPSNHSYVVTVTDGVPVTCECPADAHFNVTCKHRLAVAIRTPVLQAATKKALADGGTQPANPGEEDHNRGEHLDEASGERPEWCECDGLEDGFPCFECVERGHKDLSDV